MSRKSILTQDQLNDLAERVHDIACEVEDAAKRVSVMASLATAEPAAQFNRMIESASIMNRMLLALARREDENAAAERRIAKA